jgi:hypothetical protein
LNNIEKKKISNFLPNFIYWKDNHAKEIIILDKGIKILIFSDGKYGDRAIEVVKKKFPESELVLLEEHDPTMFLDEVFLSDDVETAIENADLLILYLRHPDVVAEICDRQIPTILPVNFGEGFYNQVKRSNPNIVQPISMCNALPNTGIYVIDEFYKEFGTPNYVVELEYSNHEGPLIKEIKLVRESPCGASFNTLNQLKGKLLTVETLNNFAINVRQECREPMTVIFNRNMADSSGATHLTNLIAAIERENPSLLKPGTLIGDYVARIRQEIEK